MNTKRWCVGLSKYFFLILFLGFFASTSFFKHAHIVDGVTIIHSHPFKIDVDGKPSHNHTPNAYLLIHLFAVFTATIICFLLIQNLFWLNQKSAYVHIKSLFSILWHYSSNPLRGPPAIY